MIRAAFAILLLAAPAAAEPITAHGVSAFGELKYPEGFEHFDYVNPEAAKGGRYASRGTAASRTFDSLNPLILKGEPAQGILQFVFDTLMVRAWDEPDAVYGLLAESITYPEDRSWAEFTLRPEAEFSDGTPVTADDVVFSLDIIQEEGAPLYRITYNDLVSAEAIDERTVRFEFREDAATRDLPMVAGSLPVLSRDYWQGRDFAESTLEPPIGSGPYEIGAVRPGRSIEYVRRDDYWAKDLPVNRGKWNFGRIIYEYYRDTTAAFESFKAGAYDLHEEFYSKLWATAYEFPAIEQGLVKLATLEDGRPSGTQGYWFNLRRPVFDDLRVRKALALAFDFEWSNRTLFYGLYERTDSFFEGSPYEAEGAPTPAQIALLEPLLGDLPEDLLEDDAYVPPKTDGSGRNRVNLRRAAKLLNDVGWAIGAGGLRRNAEGETLSVTILDDSPAFERINGPYVENLRKLGVDAAMRTVDSAQMQERLEDLDFDITIARFSTPPTPGTELRAFFSSESAEAPGSRNLAGVSNPAIDKLVEAVIGAEDRDALAAAVAALDRALRAMHIWVPQWHKGTHTIAYWDKFGRPETKPPYSRAIVETWWVDPEKAAALATARDG